MGHLKEILLECLSIQIEALIRVNSGNNFLHYLEEGTKSEGDIFKFAGLSSSMEAFFPDNILTLIRRSVRDCFCQD